MSSPPINRDRGDRLCHLMSVRGVDNKDLAKKSGVSEPTVSLWRKGHEIRSHHLEKVCIFLGATADFLLFGSGDLVPLELQAVKAIRNLEEDQAQILIQFLEALRTD